ncbi:MAG: YciE/YciF ferroxidase family protein [Mesorhizobium sp.]
MQIFEAWASRSWQGVSRQSTVPSTRDPKFSKNMTAPLHRRWPYRGHKAVERYEIARYGTLIAWGEQLGMKDAVKLLMATLEEESATGETLNALGEGGANERAEAA